MVHAFRSRQALLPENLALRQQLTVFHRRHPRLRLGAVDKLFWVFARRFWSGWENALMVVTPETVLHWHRADFRLCWSLISRARRRVGRKPLSREVGNLIFQIVAENPTWGPPRIHGELIMLGFDVSERAISRWMRHAPRDPQPARRWLTFLRNHREAIAAMTCSRCPRSPSVSCTASSSSVTTVGVSSTSTSRVILPATGSCSSYGKRFPTSPLVGSFSWIGTQSMGWKFRKPYNR
jgi:hypothetical protein